MLKEYQNLKKKKFGMGKYNHTNITLLFLLFNTLFLKVVVEVDEFTNNKDYLQDSFKFFKTLVKEAPSLFKMIEKHPLYKNDDFYKL